MASKILTFLSILTLITATEETCHPDDLKGLTSFRHGIYSDPSGRVGTWIGKSCCKWEGIECHNTSGRVTELNLPGFFNTEDGNPLQTTMNGLLSPSITLLTFLQVLDLSGLTGFNGNIPKSIGFRLKNLRKVSLWGNKLEGPLPESMSKLSKLEELYLYENSFTGSIPASIGNLKGLRVLDLHSTQLSGSIPTSISDLQGLKYLDLSNNSLSGTIPVSITKLKGASTIYLDNNRLIGEIPEVSSPDNMPVLTFLRLNDNNLSGSIPYSFGYLSCLKRVSLSNNNLNGSIPSTLFSLTSLTELYLNGNRLSGRIPSSISHLSQLLILTISNNMIQGPLPNQMTSLVNLQALDLSFNRLSLTSIPIWLLKLPSLSRIYLARCKIEGVIPEDILAMPSQIQELDLSGNHLTGKIPEWIGRLVGLYLLNLSTNFLVDMIPTSIVSLESLGVLDLHSNKLSGSIQPVFQIKSRFNEGSLAYLDLSDNNFTSGIEQVGIGIQTEIQYMNLSQNILKGKLPESIGSLEGIKSLDLSHNAIDSDLPPSLTNMISLERLKLQENHFTGKIPQGFLKFRNLKELNLSHNFLEGKIPYGEPLRHFSKDSYKGNKGLCGVPLDPCEHETIEKS